MTKEELIKLSRENLRKSKQGSLCEYYDEAFIKGYELSKKRIAELEEKISVLLSCKNCPENKGGFICQKEYENKCLAQKIQYIEELKEEMNAKQVVLNDFKSRVETVTDRFNKKSSQLTKAKEYIKLLLMNCVGVYESTGKTIAEIQAEAEQFISEVEK